MKRVTWLAFAFVMLAALFGGRPAYARDLYEFYRGVRAMSMGNAFTAVADDQDAIFYNPAGLAFNRNSLKFHFINPKFDFSADDYKLYKELSGSSPQFNAQTIQKVFGKNIYASGAVFPEIEMPFLSMGYLYQADLHMLAKNASYPQIETTYNVDRGMVLGSGFETRGFSKRHYLRFGAAVKWITRQGFDGVIPISTLVAADTASFKNLRKGPESGWGLDLGFQYDITLARLTDLTLAAAWHDIGDTQFGSRGSTSGRPPSIPTNLAAGFAITHNLGSSPKSSTSIKFSGEMRHIESTGTDIRLKTHLGAELKLYNLGIQGGLNQTSFTAGVTFELWFWKIMASTYGVDTQTIGLQDRERRYALQFIFSLGGDLRNETNSMRDSDRRKYPREYH